MSLDRVLNQVHRAAKFGDAPPSGFTRVHADGTGTQVNASFSATLQADITAALSTAGYPAIAGTLIANANGFDANYQFDLYVRCADSLPDVRNMILQHLIYRNIFTSGNNTLAMNNTDRNCTSGTWTGGGGNTSTYVVVSGDTLSRIASRFGLTLAQLLALNPQITNPNLIQVGQVINVRGVVATGTIGGGGGVIVTGTTGTGGNINPVTTTPTKDDRNWFDRTFFTGAGALTGVGIGVLIVIGAAVIVSTRD